MHQHNGLPLAHHPIGKLQSVRLKIVHLTCLDCLAITVPSR